jgi:RHS repeat-associated protein
MLWPFGDHLGTLRDLTTYNASTDDTAIANHRRFDSYGNLISETASSVDEIFGYTGRALDDSTGLQNNLNRWYDPLVGKWASEDPASFAGADSNLHRYAYNRPISHVDFTGRQGVCTTNNPLGPAPEFGGPRIEIYTTEDEVLLRVYADLPPEVIRIQVEINPGWHKVLETEVFGPWVPGPMKWRFVRGFDDLGNPVCYWTYGRVVARTHTYDLAWGPVMSARVNRQALQSQINDARASLATLVAIEAVNTTVTVVSGYVIMFPAPNPGIKEICGLVGLVGSTVVHYVVGSMIQEQNKVINQLLVGDAQAAKQPLTIFVLEDGSVGRRTIRTSQKRWVETFRIYVPCP